MKKTQLLEASRRTNEGGRDRAPGPLHLNVVLSKAALSGPSVCLQARVPCPLRVPCPVTDRAQTVPLCVPPPGSRGHAARLQACVPVAPWVKTGYDPWRSAHARTDCAPPSILCKNRRRRRACIRYSRDQSVHYCSDADCSGPLDFS